MALSVMPKAVPAANPIRQRQSQLQCVSSRFNTLGPANAGILAFSRPTGGASRAPIGVPSFDSPVASAYSDRPSGGGRLDVFSSPSADEVPALVFDRPSGGGGGGRGPPGGGSGGSGGDFNEASSSGGSGGFGFWSVFGGSLGYAGLCSLALAVHNSRAEAAAPKKACCGCNKGAAAKGSTSKKA